MDIAFSTMDSAFSTSGLVIFGFIFSIYAFLVESQLENGGIVLSSAPHPPRPPPPSQSPLPLPSRPSGPRSPLRPHPASPNHRPKAKRSRPTSNNHQSRRPPPPPPLPLPHQRKAGKKIGLVFAGIAAIMQIGVVGFLIFKRRQLLKTKDTFEISS